ncbi:MAG: BamA/TamA family outer membrane protein [Acidobacteriota bacterium]
MAPSLPPQRQLRHRLLLHHRLGRCRRFGFLELTPTLLLPVFLLALLLLISPGPTQAEPQDRGEAAGSLATKLSEALEALGLAPGDGGEEGAEKDSQDGESTTQGTQAEAQKVEVELVLEGVDGELRERLLAILGIAAAAREGAAHPEEVKVLHARAPQEIQRVLESRGYFRAEILDSLELLPPEAIAREQRPSLDTVPLPGYRAVYRIELGTPLRITERSLEILPIPPPPESPSSPPTQDEAFQRWLETYPLAPGDILDQGTYIAARDRLTGLAARRGYFRARFQQAEIRIDRDANTAQILLRFDPGPRYRFGAVDFQQDSLDPQLLGRFVPFSPGDPYDANQVLGLQQRLLRAPYFDRVTVRPQRPSSEAQSPSTTANRTGSQETPPESQDDPPDEIQQPTTAALSIPVTVTPSFRRRESYSLSAGYGTDTGARLSAGWEMVRVNRYGHYAEAQIKLSERETSGGARYVVPLIRQNLDERELATSSFGDSAITLAAGIEDKELETSESTLSFASLRWGSPWGRWRQVVALSYEDHEYSVGSIDQGQGYYLLPSISLSYFRSQGRGRPSSLDNFSLELKGASDRLFSDDSLIRGHVRYSLARSLGEGTRILARGELGVLTSPDFRQLPPALRFFAGGDQSVRGYDFQSLGPKVEDQVVGGRFVASGSLELETRVRGMLGAAVFWDVGNAFDNVGDALEQGAGVGLRVFSPVGVFKADVAWGLTERNPSGNRPVRLHLSFGWGF